MIQAGRDGVHMYCSRYRRRQIPPSIPRHLPVKVTDQPVAIPYGIYDLATNAGWVNIGTDHDTAAFAVELLPVGA